MQIEITAILNCLEYKNKNEIIKNNNKNSALK
jgi:hypothetical protein